MFELKFKNFIYKDTYDHLNNGLLRLLNMNFQTFEKWLSVTDQIFENNIINSISKSFLKINPYLIGDFKKIKNSGPLKENGLLWFPAIGENSNYGIGIDENKQIAWLINNTLNREINPPQYDENYFEGDPSISGGYGSYKNQESWRLEKSKRQVLDLVEITGVNKGYVLDIGSGYGFFRKALDEHGFKHEGIEISSHAVEFTKNIFNFPTYLGTVSDYYLNFKEKFDIITLWDVLEHIPDPISFLKEIFIILRPGGFVVIKTPNITCVETEVFGPYYHSFKREHLVYFSKKSLELYASYAGLKLFTSKSKSHLLQGFVSENQIKSWENSIQGSDIICYFQKPNY